MPVCVKPVQGPSQHQGHLDAIIYKENWSYIKGFFTYYIYVYSYINIRAIMCIYIYIYYTLNNSWSLQPSITAELFSLSQRGTPTMAQQRCLDRAVLEDTCGMVSVWLMHLGIPSQLTVCRLCFHTSRYCCQWLPRCAFLHFHPHQDWMNSHFMAEAERIRNDPKREVLHVPKEGPASVEMVSRLIMCIYWQYTLQYYSV